MHFVLRFISACILVKFHMRKSCWKECAWRFISACVLAQVKSTCGIVSKAYQFDLKTYIRFVIINNFLLCPLLVYSITGYVHGRATDDRLIISIQEQWGTPTWTQYSAITDDWQVINPNWRGQLPELSKGLFPCMASQSAIKSIIRDIFN